LLIMTTLTSARTTVPEDSAVMRWETEISKCATLSEMYDLLPRIEQNLHNEPGHLLMVYRFYQQKLFPVLERQLKEFMQKPDRARYAALVQRFNEERKKVIVRSAEICPRVPEEEKDADLQRFCVGMLQATRFIRFQEDLKRKPAPDFEFTDLQGRQRRLSDFRKRYVLLHFWSRHSVPCMEELNDLRQAYERFRGKGLEIVSIHCSPVAGQWDDQVLRNLVEQMALNWTHVIGAQALKIKEMYFVRNYPTLYLLDHNGKVIKEEQELRAEKLLQTLNSVLGK